MNKLQSLLAVCLIAFLLPACASVSPIDHLPISEQAHLKYSDNSEQVRIMGASVETGFFDLNQDDSIFDMLTKAGGISSSGNHETVIVARGEAGQIVKLEKFDMKAYVEGEPVTVPEIEPGDTIYVLEADQETLFIKLLNGSTFVLTIVSLALLAV